jgi:hypothetical protein
MPLELSINDGGTIAGTYTTSATGMSAIFLYDSSGFHSLGFVFGLSDEFDRVSGINNAGVIVGDSGNSDRNAWAYLPGSGFTRLDSLIPSDSGWHLQEAPGINNNGQIIGAGSINGRGPHFCSHPSRFRSPATSYLSCRDLWLESFTPLGDDSSDESF